MSPANIVQDTIVVRSFFTFQIKSKNICLKHCNQVHQVNFIHFFTISDDQQR